MKSFKFALIAACAAAVSLNAEVLTKTTDISRDGKKVGKIEVLTPVEVVSKDGAKAKIKVKGAVSFINFASFIFPPLKFAVE